MNKFDLEERLIKFSVLIIYIVNETPSSKAGNHLAGQLVRSGTNISSSLLWRRAKYRIEKGLYS